MTESKPKRVFLIDSMSHIFRAFFAPMGRNQEPLRNSKGELTQAVFVFTNILRKLIADEKPDYIAAIFDTAAPTFRHDNFADYKANREAMPEELSAQLPFIIRVCEAMNVPIIKRDGFEADDLIGTFAKQCEEQNLQAVIVSNDKDLCQLVKDPYIVCMRQNAQNIRRKVPVPLVEWCDEAWVEKKFELPPNKIIDYLGLMGDSVDNIPGAPGIGEKGAIKLIKEFGSAEGAMENADKVTHKTYRESLQNNKDLIRLSVDLATVKTDVPVKLDLDELKLREPDRLKSYELFRELEFNTLTREFADAATLFSDTSSPSSVDSPRKYSLIDNQDALNVLVRELWERENWSFAVDDSNSPPDKSSYYKKPALGIAIATGKGISYYIDLDGFKDEKSGAIETVNSLLSNVYLDKSTYDLKRNIAAIEPLGITATAVTDDVMIAAYLIDTSRRNFELRALAQQDLNQDQATEIPEGWKESQYRVTENADFTFQLTPELRKRILADDLKRVYEDIELPLISVLYDLEMAGIRLHASELKTVSDHLKVILGKLESRIFELGGREFNINSPKQVGEVLTELNIETKFKTPKGQISTSREALQEIGETYEIAKLVIEYREMDKLKSTYADSLPQLIADDGRIHGILNQTVAATGRLSSTDPNLQNIPVRTELGKEIRRAFVPADGCKFVSADYSQLELRILAHITKDPVMLHAFKNGIDIHAQTAELIFGASSPEELKEKRRFAKIVNFGIAYAVEPFGLSQRVGISVSEAKKVIQDYYANFVGIKAYMDETPEIARKQGYVSTLFGRRRYLHSINDKNFAVRARAEREAINMPIQGTASDIVKIAMLNVQEALIKRGFKSRMLMQIHDELLIESPIEEIESIKLLLVEAMESAATLDIPLVVDVGTGDNWMDAKS